MHYLLNYLRFNSLYDLHFGLGQGLLLFLQDKECLLLLVDLIRTGESIDIGGVDLLLDSPTVQKVLQLLEESILEVIIAGLPGLLLLPLHGLPHCRRHL